MTSATQQQQQPPQFEVGAIGGRAPWYSGTSGENGRRRPFIIGIAGGTASGKTTVCRKVVARLGTPWVLLLSMDRYYRSLTTEERANVANYNFDHPDAFAWDSLRQTIADLRAGRVTEAPNYDFATHSVLPDTDTLYGADVIIVEGIFVLYDKAVRAQFDMMVFVDTDADLRLARRIQRDVVERARDVNSIIHQYVTTVKPSFDDFIAPTMRFADIIVPRGGDNEVAINLLVEHVRHRLQERGHRLHNGTMVQVDANQLPRPEDLPNIRVVPQTQALRLVFTVLRDQTTTRDVFRAYSDRLCRALWNEMSECIPHTTTNDSSSSSSSSKYGQQQNVCVVAVSRAGAIMTGALAEELTGVPIGKVVIRQTTTTTTTAAAAAAAPVDEHEPRFYYCKFPPHLSTMHVVVLDGVMSTGSNATMAINVLLDHGVREENITLGCLLAAPHGLHTLTTTFPSIKICTACIDDGLDGHQYVKPGLGKFAGRYYGTA